jgi:hypothetical protein
MRYGPFFANNLGMFSFDAGHRGQVVIEQAHNVEGDRPVLDVVIDAAL